MSRKKPEAADELLEKGLDLLYTQKPAEAVTYLKDAYAEAPDNGRIASALALCYSILNNKPRAIELYKKAIENSPEDVKNYYCLGRLYIEDNKQVEGMSVLARGIYVCKEKLKKFPEVETFLDLAKFYAYQNQHDESILTLFKALASNPENAEIYRMLAEEYFNLSLYRESIIEAQKSIKYNDRDPEAFLYAGLSCHKLNIIDRALYYFSRSLALNPDQKELKSLHDKLIELKSKNGLTVEEIMFNARPGERFLGIVKWFNDDNGIGYIIKKDDAAEVFVHYLAIDCDGYQGLHEGDEVEFSTVPGHTGLIATNVKNVSKVKPYLKSGRVKWYDEERGVGEIILDNGETVHFHYTAITRDGIKSVKPQARISCELFDGENGPQAFNIRETENGVQGLIADQNATKYSGKIKWTDKNKNIGIIEEMTGMFQAIFKISDAIERGVPQKSLKTGAVIKFDVVDVESLESENVKKAINIEVTSDEKE